LTHHKNTPGPTVYLPNGATLNATSQAHLPCSNKLSQAATLTHIFPGLQTTSLISLGQLCDHNCKIVLDKNNVFVIKNGEIIITGHRNRSDGLWDIPVSQHNAIKNSTLSTTKSQKMNVILTKDKTKHELVNYLHACCFSPTKRTFLQAIKKGNFITWPGLTTELVSKHLITPIATAKGHLTQERKNFNQQKILNKTLLMNLKKMNLKKMIFFPQPENSPPT